MQEFLDSKLEELKLMSDFDIEKENIFLKMSVDDFYFHVWIKDAHTKHNGN